MAIGMRKHRLTDLLCGELAVLSLTGNDLMPASFHSAGFMHVDVPGFSGNRRFKGTQQMCNRHRVGGRSADGEEHLRVFASAQRADLLRRAAGILILAVTRRTLEIGAHQTLQHLRARALFIIASETNHAYSFPKMSLNGNESCKNLCLTVFILYVLCIRVNPRPVVRNAQKAPRIRHRTGRLSDEIL